MYLNKQVYFKIQKIFFRLFELNFYHQQEKL